MAARARLLLAGAAILTVAATTAALVGGDAVRVASFCVADPTGRACGTGAQAQPSPSPPPSPVPTPGSAPTTGTDPIRTDRVLWGDEFDGGTVDTSKWTIRDRGYAANEASCQLASQVSEGDGVLSIRVDRGSYTCGSRVSPYASGYVDSIGKGPPLGVGSRFEWRARLPVVPRASQGYWPALWLRSNQPGSSNQAGEIDAVEAWGAFRPEIVDSDHATVHSVHEDTDGIGGRSTSVHRWGTRYPGDGFHIYAVDLLPDRIRFSVDRKVVHTVRASTDPWVANLLGAGVTWNVRMNVQICNSRTWCSAPNAETRFGQSMDVDYVRVYG